MPEILRAASQPAVAWKNGGGLTRTVAAFPADSDLTSFEWRVSTAQVRAAGPFSRFADVDRRLAVLEGRLALSVEARPPVTLGADSPPVLFPGDVAAFGEPLDGPVLDLNVMTRRGRFESRLESHTLSEPLELEPGPGTLLVLALSDLSLLGAHSGVRLARLDAARIEVGPARSAVLRISAPASCYLIRVAACA